MIANLVVGYPQPDDAAEAYAGRQLEQLNAGGEARMVERMLAVAAFILDAPEYDNVAPRLELLQVLRLDSLLRVVDGGEQ